MSQQSPDLPSDEPKPKVSDAEALFRDPSETKLKEPQSASGFDLSGSNQYEVEGLPESDQSTPAVESRAVEPLIPPKSSRTASSHTKAVRPELDPALAVEEVWSRTSEWGATLAALAVEAVSSLFVIYLLLSWELYSLAFLGLLAGGIGFLLVSYPILITLERPVRVTPEQALKDFYGALAHHRPHYTRMWLLLSSAGKVSSSFGSFEGFRAYWSDKLDHWRKGRTSKFTPLKFEISDFKAEKSAGKTTVEARYTLRVLIRGKQVDGPIETFKVESTFVKGPDRMWYLDDGALP